MANKQELAEIAARIMHQQRLQDYGVAKRKALETLATTPQTAMPENRLINEALQRYIACFGNADDQNWAAQLKRSAKEASAFLSEFPHYIAGSLASNIAKLDDRLEIHLYSDSTEPLLWTLQDHHIPYREQERVVRINRQTEASYPCFSFVANDIPVSITVFPDSRPRPRQCDIDGSPMPRLKPKQLGAL
jgi:hypothetical protein